MGQGAQDSNLDSKGSQDVAVSLTSMSNIPRQVTHGPGENQTSHRVPDR